MSYPKDLDEYTDEQLEKEQEARRNLRQKGLCTYCRRPSSAPTCRFPERHVLGVRRPEAVTVPLRSPRAAQGTATKLQSVSDEEETHKLTSLVGDVPMMVLTTVNDEERKAIEWAIRVLRRQWPSMPISKMVVAILERVRAP